MAVIPQNAQLGIPRNAQPSPQSPMVGQLPAGWRLSSLHPLPLVPHPLPLACGYSVTRAGVFRDHNDDDRHAYNDDHSANDDHSNDEGYESKRGDDWDRDDEYFTLPQAPGRSPIGLLTCPNPT
ncbi:hypothetical protein BKA70DRAFT_1421496 [Coprinopsis sp. MPI-PUGE-AT-0042]|nr:hypothetical protein BKA70DRAFT_1421496 [Coprinopsis sp. MPI-PUGE-AT-0042]